MSLPQFIAYVAPARARPQLWRLIAGLVLGLVIYLGWIAAVFFAVLGVAGQQTTFAMLRGMEAPDRPTVTLLLLFTFVGMALAPVAAARLLHGRRAGTLIGPRPRALRHFCISALVLAAIYGVGLGLWSLQYDSRPGLPPALWLGYLPLALLGVLVQTGAEELLFRGYLLQQLAARFRSALVWLLLPALIFGAIHFDPTMAGRNAWLVVASATLFGLIAADLTRVTGTLGAAWGLHFANNTVAILVLATEGTITGLALRLTPYSMADAGLSPLLIAGDLALLVFAWALLRRVFATLA